MIKISKNLEKNRFLLFWLIRILVILLILLELQSERGLVLYLYLMVFLFTFIPSAIQRIFSIEVNVLARMTRYKEIKSNGYSNSWWDGEWY